MTLVYPLLDGVMPIHEKHQVILRFDSWYVKRVLFALTLSYSNLNMICNARRDTAIFELPYSTADHRSRPPKYSKRLMLDEIPVDLKHNPFKIDGHLFTHRLVKTCIFSDHTGPYLRGAEQERLTPSLFQHRSPDGPAHEHCLAGEQDAP